MLNSGLEATRSHVYRGNPNGRYHFGIWNVSTDTLNQLITGEVRFYDDFEIEMKKELSQNKSKDVSILYQWVNNPENKLKEEYYIHTIFINESIL